MQITGRDSSNNPSHRRIMEIRSVLNRTSRVRRSAVVSLIAWGQINRCFKINQIQH